MTDFFRRLWYLLNRRRFDAELANDLDVHRELAARAGQDLPFSGTLRLRDEARDAWGWTWIDRLAQDLRYAARMLRKAPGFSATAILMLAIGIGVNVAAFGFFNLMFLRALPVRDPDTILRFQRRSAEGYATEVPYPAMTFYRDQSRTLSAMLAVNFARLALDGEPKPLSVQFVTANFFSELGGAAMLGRPLDPIRDDGVNAAPVVVLGRGFWQRRFGSDRLVIGQTLRLNGKPATVVGVASQEFSGLHADQPDLWIPIMQQPYFVAGSRLLTDDTGEQSGVNMWGRLRPGATPRMAEEELRSLAARLREQHPKAVWEHERLVSQPGAYGTGTRSGASKGSGEMPNDRGERYTVAALVGVLALLILAAACANLGSLLLARGVAREREIMIRAAVGAGSGRLIRQLFTESLLLAVLGSIAGLGLGYIVLHSVMVWSEAPAWIDATPDWHVVAFAIGAGFAAAILFGLMPAFQTARRRHHASITRQILIGAQVAASCVLLVVAGLLTRAVNHLMFTPPGFDYEHVLAINPGLSAHGYSPAKARAYLDTLDARIGQLPGVESIARAFVAPLGNSKIVMDSVVAPGRKLAMYVNHVDPPFFQTMRIPILRGRTFAPGDTHAIIVSASAATRAWPGDDPVGKTMAIGDDAPGAATPYTVVGVAGDARVVALEDPDAVEIYFPIDPDDLPSLNVVVRSSAPTETLAPLVVALTNSLDAEVFPNVQVLKTSFRRKLQTAERSALAVSVLGVSALLLACLGIVGLVAYAVSQRTKEIGIRIALGAARSHVLAVVLRQFSRPVVAGLLIGMGGAAALAQVLRQQLYGISSLDPTAYLAAIAIFVITVAVAALFPARRALRVDPLRALRFE
jgi:predicted permease